MLTVARRDIRALFDHPTGYILLVVFLAINNFLFFRTAYLIGVASMRPMMDLLPWLFLFFVPAVTMRSLAEEQKSGTLEIVLAQPISELSYLLGKYLAQVVFVWSALALTLAIPLGLSLGADLQMGIIFAQFFGAGLLGLGFVAVGIWTSSLTENQITAFIIGVSLMFGLVLVGLDPLVVGLPPTLGTIAARLGVLSHFANIGRGVIDLRDVVYFATMAAAFISLAYLSLMRRKLSRRGSALKRLKVGTGLVVAILIVINLFGGQIGGRLDLTPGKLYTLSGATRTLVRGLDDIVTIKLFATWDLPSQIQLLKRDIDDLLRDYRSAANGKIRIRELNPDEDESIAQEARGYGIPAVQFNVVGESELQIKEGYLGLVVQYAEAIEIIPFIRRADDLEYRISSFIRGLTSNNIGSVGLITTPGNPQQPTTFNNLRAALAETYTVVDLDLPLDSTFDASLKAIIFAGDPDSITGADLSTLAEYVAGGGAAFVAARGMSLSLQQQQIAFAKEVSLNDFLAPYGIAVNSDLVYDLASNERVAFNSRIGRVMTSYPFWARPISTKASVVNQELEGLFTPWVSTIDTTNAIAGTITPLFVSSAAAGVEAGMSFLSLTRQFLRDSLRSRLVAVQVNLLAGDSAIGRGRLVVTGNSDFISDNYSANAPENLAFALNAIDWLAQDEDLIAIRAKNRRPPQLAFTTDTKRDLAKYFNLLGVPILVVLVAMLRLMRRRRFTGRKYERGAE